jgi:hypothetical protein
VMRSYHCYSCVDPPPNSTVTSSFKAMIVLFFRFLPGWEVLRASAVALTEQSLAVSGICRRECCCWCVCVFFFVLS